jgi:O-antigen/teichoic acid export membrane protein
VLPDVNTGIDLTEQSKSVEDAAEGVGSATLHYDGKEPLNLSSRIDPFQLLKSFRNLLKGTLARNASWMLLGQGFKLLIQALYFTLIARSLGPQNYGAFVGVVGLVGILLPFATMGSGYLLIKNVARDECRFRKDWGSALLTTLLSASVLFGVVILISRFVLPASIPIRLVIMVAAADLFGTSIAVICGHSFIAFERMKWAACLNVFLSALRLVAAIILATAHASPTALQWGGLYLGSTSIVMLLALLLVSVKLGTPTFGFSRSAAEIREGLYFSVMQSAQTIYNDIDKAMLSRLSTLEATGIYGAAYRIVDVSFAPVAAVLVAAFPGFFRVGADGISATLRYVKPLILRALGYAALVAVGLLIGARLLPLILGDEYRLTVEALRWLAVLPLLKAVHSFLADALTGAGYQALRTVISAGVAVFNVLINIWIIPLYSWRGAAWSSIASDALLIFGIGTAVFILSRRSQSFPGRTKALDARAEA